MQGVGAGKQEPQGRIRRPVHQEQLLGQQRGGKRDGYLLGQKVIPQRRGGADGPIVGDVQTGACRQRRPNLPDRRVEGQPRDLAGAIGRRDAKRPLVPLDEIQQVFPGDFDALGMSRGPGRVDDVRQTLRRGIPRRHRGPGEPGRQAGRERPARDSSRWTAAEPQSLRPAQAGLANPPGYTPAVGTEWRNPRASRLRLSSTRLVAAATKRGDRSNNKAMQEPGTTPRCRRQAASLSDWIWRSAQLNTWLPCTMAPPLDWRPQTTDLAEDRIC